MLRIYTARWVLPIATDPIPHGAVAVDGGRIEGVGPAEDLRGHFPDAEVEDLGPSLLLPALVNAHVHLGITALHGKAPLGEGLVPWLAALVPQARALDGAALAVSVRQGLELSYARGTGVLGDVVTNFAVLDTLAGDDRFLVRAFLEHLGVSPERGAASLDDALRRADALESGGPVHAGLSPHAPYSVRPEDYDRSIDEARERGLPWTSHVAEDPAEAEFLEHGTGRIRDYLEGLGVDLTGFQPRRPLERLAAAGRLDEHALLVHGVHLTEREVELLTVNDAALCLCPTSNRVLGLPPAPVADLARAGVFLCLGTDSLASNEDLSVWREMRAVRKLAPDLPAEQILRMATAHGAMALGFGGRVGTIHPGAWNRLVAVEAADLGDGDPAAFLVETPVEDRLRVLRAAPPIW